MCDIDFGVYRSNPKVLTMRILESHLEEILHDIKNLKKGMTNPEAEYATIAVGYQILALLILETGSFLPDIVGQEVLKSTTWEYDYNQWKWSSDLIKSRKPFLKQFRRTLRRYSGEKGFIENIPNKSRLLERIFGIDDFSNYLNSGYSFRSLIKAFSIKFLYLDMCQLELIPKEVFLCKDLEELSLSNNYLQEIPKEINRLRHLKKLILSHNKISSLPNEIGSLKSLELLWVDDNLLTSLPSSINLLDLKDFDTRGNPHESLRC